MIGQHENWTLDDGQQLLMCAGCGSVNTHHTTVQVFNRDKEDADGTRTTVAASTHVDRCMKENPSLRRDGIKIQYYCENCSAASVLTLAQHKGVTYVHTFVTDYRYCDYGLHT